MNLGIEMMERGMLPEWVIRKGIRRLVSQRVEVEREKARVHGGPELAVRQFADSLRADDIAYATDAANEQHYELPPEFFALVLGDHLKYSGCYWGDGVRTLSDAESAMLDMTVERADIHDGMNVLELGCGWGAVTMAMARRYPNARITAVSNSGLQKRFIDERARNEGIANVQVVTADVSRFDTDARFDRVVSVEMFEHMHNYEKLLANIARWLTPEGRLFVHIFCHKRYPYHFRADGNDSWMSEHFFTGGIMPSEDLLRYFQRDLVIQRQWRINGKHYQKTAEAWAANMQRNRNSIMAIMRRHYGSDAERWFIRWKVFFLACAELFGFNDGNEWWIAHYLFDKRRAMEGLR